MLPAAHRLTDPAAFSTTVRTGVRSGGRALVVHLHTDGTSTTPPRVGLVVSKSVGSAVARTRVKRRLRHQVAPHLAALPPGTTVVLRALPPAADSSSAELAEELRTALTRCLRRTPQRMGQMTGMTP